MKPWERQERRVAKKTGGKQQPGSGSGWLHGNDVKDDEYLREMKQTGAASITIKLADWEKLRKNAITLGRRPALHIEIGKRRLVLLDESDVI